MSATCAICGHEISSEESLKTGLGAECRAAYNYAIFKVIMSDPENSFKYNWKIQANIYRACFIEMFSNTKFRSAFNASFYESICKSERISKKQLEIIIEKMYSKDIKANGKCFDETKLQKALFLEEKKKDVNISAAAIEMARKQIRETRKVS
jgi:hypothetical protein